jgi:hypothetical protein
MTVISVSYLDESCQNAVEVQPKFLIISIKTQARQKRAFFILKREKRRRMRPPKSHQEALGKGLAETQGTGPKS